MAKIVQNRLLGGWFVVTGPHHFPLAGPFPSKAEAKAWGPAQQAARDAKMPAARYVTGDGRRFVERENALAYAARVHRQTGNIIAVEEIR
jgi:hypothetical protein